MPSNFKRFATIILHTGINEILNLGSNIDFVRNNILNIANECKSYGIKNIFVLGRA